MLLLATNNFQVSLEDLRLAVATMAFAVLYTSAQRPGAVLNATVDEYRAATVVKDTLVIKVQQTKGGGGIAFFSLFSKRTFPFVTQ